MYVCCCLAYQTPRHLYYHLNFDFVCKPFYLDDDIKGHFSKFLLSKALFFIARLSICRFVSTKHVSNDFALQWMPLYIANGIDQTTCVASHFVLFSSVYYSLYCPFCCINRTWIGIAVTYCQKTLKFWILVLFHCAPLPMTHFSYVVFNCNLKQDKIDFITLLVFISIHGIFFFKFVCKYHMTAVRLPLSASALNIHSINWLMLPSRQCLNSSGCLLFKPILNWQFAFYDHYSLNTFLIPHWIDLGSVYNNWRTSTALKLKLWNQVQSFKL